MHRSILRISLGTLLVASAGLVAPTLPASSPSASAVSSFQLLAEVALPGTAIGAVSRPLAVVGSTVFIADDSRVFAMGVDNLALDDTLGFPSNAGTSTPFGAASAGGKAFFVYRSRQVVAVSAPSGPVTVIPAVCGTGGLVYPWITTHDDSVYVGCGEGNFVARVNSTTLTADDTFATGPTNFGNKAMAVIDDTGYITNDASSGNGSVTVVNLLTNPPTPSTTVPVQQRPHGITSFDDTLYAANLGSNTVSILKTRPSPPTVASTTSLTAGQNGPGSIVACQDNVFTGKRGSVNYVTRLDPATGAASNITHSSISDPHTLAVDQGSTFALSINSRAVTVIDCATRAVTSSVTLSSTADWPYYIAFSPYRAFVTSVGGANGYLGVIQTGTPPPAPTPAPPPPAPAMTPTSQVVSGVAGKPIAPTSAFTLENFTLVPRYSAYPALPAGLSLDPGTGIVSGTPTEPYPATRHWITASAGGNSQSAYSVLEVSVSADVPGQPSAVTASAGDAEADVAWTAPSSDGGSAVLEYVAQATPGGQTCTTTTSLTCTVAGLTNGTAYTFTVRARNSVGWGAWSSPSPVVTPQAAGITITGSRTGRTVTIEGIASGIDPGSKLTPWLRLGSNREFELGKLDVVVEDGGGFTWERRTRRNVTVYFTHGTTESNAVTITR